MIFPIGDQNIHGGSKPIVSYTLIGINVLVFIFQALMPPEIMQGFVYTYGSIPAEISNGEDWYTMFTSMFLHGGWMHLIGNMMFLWVFGDNIEAVIGNIKFLLFYLAGGVTAAVGHTMAGPGSEIPAVGASGAIAAVLGAYLVMFPRSKVQLIVIIIFYRFKVAAIYFLGIWIIQQLINGFAALGPETAHSAGVAWWAHIGGFVFGVLLGFTFRKNIDQYALR